MAEAIEAQLITESPGMRQRPARAEVVVNVRGKSVTRHLQLKSGGWIGNHPDMVAMGKLDVAENELARAEGQLSNAGAKLARVKNGEDKDITEKQATRRLVNAQKYVAGHKRKASEIETETPRMPEFTF